MVNAETLALRLTASAAHSLAVLVVEQTLDTPMHAWLPADEMAKWLREFLNAWLASDQGLEFIHSTVEIVVERLQREKRPMREWLSRDVHHTLRELVARPFSPDRRLVLTIIDRRPTRDLVRQLLLDAVIDFGRKASAPVAGMAKGLSSLARLAGETVKSRGGGLGSLVGAVGEEVERQLDRRAAEFVDGALTGVFGQLADSVTDPKRAHEAAELRLAILDGFLEATGPQLARELTNLDAGGAASLLRESLRRWLNTREAQPALRMLTTAMVDAGKEKTVRELLSSLGLLDVARHFAQEQLTLQIQRVAASPAFLKWLQGIVASAT